MDELKLGIVVAQIINFGILFFIFKHFLGKKIVETIESRREHLRLSEEAQKEAREKIKKAKAEAEELIKKAREKAGEIKRSAEDISRQNAQDILNKAEKEANYIIKRTEADLEKDRISMLNSMKSKILDLSLKLTSKLFNKESANKDFLEKELELLLK